ncbi:MAG: hypothetical protein U9Q92_07395 [archaeon]|nr:hypothetical protein [archaeon]
MAEWNRTHIMKERLGLNDLESERYQGRPIIHRDSPVDGGVYLGQGQREAIVVDSQKYPKLRQLYEVAKGKATERRTVRKDRVLQAVYDTVAEAMPRQDNDAVKELIHRYKVEKDGKISLDDFLEEGVGVCRHDALACATLLELFKKEGIVRGKTSVDRNSTYLGGHAWCRYTNSADEIFILDIAQRYIGRLEDASNGDRWAYQRPEDF